MRGDSVWGDRVGSLGKKRVDGAKERGEGSVFERDVLMQMDG